MLLLLKRLLVRSPVTNLTGRFGFLLLAAAFRKRKRTKTFNSCSTSLSHQVLTVFTHRVRTPLRTRTQAVEMSHNSCDSCPRSISSGRTSAKWKQKCLLSAQFVFSLFPSEANWSLWCLYSALTLLSVYSATVSPTVACVWPQTDSSATSWMGWDQRSLLGARH